MIEREDKSLIGIYQGVRQNLGRKVDVSYGKGERYSKWGGNLIKNSMYVCVGFW